MKRSSYYLSIKLKQLPLRIDLETLEISCSKHPPQNLRNLFQQVPKYKHLVKIPTQLLADGVTV